jgi:uncharacterized repeat protein (TIGR02543 family)
VGGKVLQPASDPTRTGFVFDGWYANASCTTAWDFAANAINKDTTIYAKWQTPPPPTYQVTYHGNKSTSGSAPDQATCNANESHTVKAHGNLARTNYHFVGWSESSTATKATYVAGDVINDINKNYDLYAVWAKNPTTAKKSFTVTYNGNENSSGTAPSAATVSAGQDHEVKGAGSLARSGYSFAGWSENADATTASYSAGDEIEDIQRNYKLYAIWKAKAGKASTTNTSVTSTSDPTVEKPAVDESAEPAIDWSVPPQIQNAFQLQQQHPEAPILNANEQTLENIRANGIPTIKIGGQDVPLSGFGYSGVWSMLDLFLLTLIILLAVYSMARLVISNKKNPSKRHLVFNIAVPALALIAFVVFVLTENIGSLMVIFDTWSVMMALIIIAQVILIAITKTDSNHPAVS